MHRPIIGITADNADNTAASGRYESPVAYSRAVADAGGTPLILPHATACVDDYLRVCDGLLLSGGVDPRMETFGKPTDPRVRPMDQQRQTFELALLEALDGQPRTPVLGVCLGMQLMALRTGGDLHQVLPDVLDTASQHEGDQTHDVQLLVDDGPLADATAGGAEVVSHHRQAVSQPGALRVAARSADGVIEAIDDPSRPFYLGVQWHPERGDGGELNRGLIRRLVDAARPAT